MELLGTANAAQRKLLDQVTRRIDAGLKRTQSTLA